MKKMSTIIIMLVLISSLVALELFAAEPPRPTAWSYWEKGNKGEKLSYSEFKILVSELERCMVAFKDKFSKLSIEDANFSYKAGKTWEIMHKTTVEQFGFAFECLEAVKKLPNQITPSFTLYVILKDLAETSNDFDNIERFSKKLGNTHVELNIWTRAFEKAHLSRLAESKDKGVDLYKMK